jgi:hypothetical protein
MPVQRRKPPTKEATSRKGGRKEPEEVSDDQESEGTPSHTEKEAKPKLPDPEELPEQSWDAPEGVMTSAKLKSELEGAEEESDRPMLPPLPAEAGTEEVHAGEDEALDEDPYGERDYPAEDDEIPGEAEGTYTGPVDRDEDEDEEDPDGDRTGAGPPLKLLLVAGPDAGRKKKFQGVRMVIGRGVGCELVLTDPSVSRKHLELVKSDKGVLVRDLGSSAGTMVNGQKVTDVILANDDEIQIGKTKIRFIDEAAIFKKMRADAAAKEAEEAARREAAAAGAAAPAAAAAAAPAAEGAPPA